MFVFEVWNNSCWHSNCFGVWFLVYFFFTLKNIYAGKLTEYLIIKNYENGNFMNIAANHGEFLQVAHQERGFEILQTSDLCLLGRKQMYHNLDSQLLEI